MRFMSLFAVLIGSSLLIGCTNDRPQSSASGLSETKISSRSDAGIVDGKTTVDAVKAVRGEAQVFDLPDGRVSLTWMPERITFVPFGVTAIDMATNGKPLPLRAVAEQINGQWVIVQHDTNFGQPLGRPNNMTRYGSQPQQTVQSQKIASNAH